MGKGECGISSGTPGTGRGSPYQIWFRLQPHPSSWWAPLFSESPSVVGVLFSAISSLYSGSLWSPLGSDSSAGFEQDWGAPYVLGVLDWMAWVWWCGLAMSDPWYGGQLAASGADTVYPKKYAHGFVVLCFVVVMQSFIMNSHEVFIHIHQGCFAGTGAIVRLPQCQWSKPDGYGKISQCITTTKHSKAKTVCIFLGIYCNCKNR